MWLIAFAGWMFCFYELVLFSLLPNSIGRDSQLTEGQEIGLHEVPVGASGIGGISFVQPLGFQPPQARPAVDGLQSDSRLDRRAPGVHPLLIANRGSALSFGLRPAGDGNAAELVLNYSVHTRSGVGLHCGVQGYRLPNYSQRRSETAGC
jgi:hypothetical protein